MSYELKILFIISILFIVLITLLFSISIYIHNTKYKVIMQKRQQAIEKRIKSIDKVAYTQIIYSGNETYGSMSIYQGTGSGSTNSINITKFLIVYKNGKQEIYSVADGTKLCRLYTQLLKKE